MDPATLASIGSGGGAGGAPSLSSSSSATSGAGPATSGPINQSFGGLTVGTPSWVWLVLGAFAFIAFLVAVKVWG